MRKPVALIALSLLGMAFCRAQDATTQPTTRATPSTQERLSDLVALLEVQNSPEARRTIARELLLNRWTETPARVAALLAGPNAAAKVALAAALVDLPEFLDPAYIEPLIGMLGDSDAAVREAAAGALATYSDHGVTTRLRQLAAEAERPRLVRLAAVSALGLMTERAAIGALVQVLGDPDPGLAQAALAALGRATAIDFNDDISAARSWWEESSTLPLEAWQQRQIERLVRKDRDSRRRLEAVESRLAKLLEATFLRAPDTERVSLLAAYLSDSSTTIRLLGLRLTQLHLAEGKSLPSELQDRVRELLASLEPAEQAAAVRTVASFREPRDADRFLEMLPKVRAREVRMALLNGLGHVGGGSAADVLLNVLDDPDEQCVTEAVAALGRLAERGAIEASAREAVATALLGVFEHTKLAQGALRERVLWAMGNIADPRFGPAFATALERQEAVSVRQAAVRGMAALKDSQLADALATAASDPDGGVRKTAVDALVTLGASDSEKPLHALWERAVSPLETDETIRQAAWRGVLDTLSKASADEIERWIAKLTTSAPQERQRAAELLERLARAAAESEPVDRGRLGLVRARLAALYVQLDRPADAVAAYLEAITDLRAAKSEATERATLDLLRCALVAGRYDETIASVLSSANPGPERGTMWQTVKSVVEPQLTPDGAERALALLAAVEKYPPGAWPQDVLDDLKILRARATRLIPSSTESLPATQPTSSPASRPGS